ncbi:MAG: hypothetical protein ACJ79U_14650 [Myxococcales bacterium]
MPLSTLAVRVLALAVAMSRARPSAQDLPALRNVTGASGAVNPRFLSPTGYQLPVRVRLGARVTF